MSFLLYSPRLSTKLLKELVMFNLSGVNSDSFVATDRSTHSGDV